jgi:hypothetical protein
MPFVFPFRLKDMVVDPENILAGLTDENLSHVDDPHRSLDFMLNDKEVREGLEEHFRLRAFVVGVLIDASSAEGVDHEASVSCEKVGGWLAMGAAAEL